MEKTGICLDKRRTRQSKRQIGRLREFGASDKSERVALRRGYMEARPALSHDITKTIRACLVARANVGVVAGVVASL